MKSILVRAEAGYKTIQQVKNTVQMVIQMLEVTNVSLSRSCIYDMFKVFAELVERTENDFYAVMELSRERFESEISSIPETAPVDDTLIKLFND